MIIRPVTKAEIQGRLALAHESDGATARPAPDIKVFYNGFEETGDTIVGNGAAAIQYKRSPGEKAEIP